MVIIVVVHIQHLTLGWGRKSMLNLFFACMDYRFHKVLIDRGLKNSLCMGKKVIEQDLTRSFIQYSIEKTVEQRFTSMWSYKARKDIKITESDCPLDWRTRRLASS